VNWGLFWAWANVGLSLAVVILSARIYVLAKRGAR
jgi:hypothetical protein